MRYFVNKKLAEPNNPLFKEFLKVLQFDVDEDQQLKGTPERVAKMYVQEVFKGRYLPPPKITDFPNAKNLDQIYTIGPISVRSACSHHLVPIVGQAWIVVIPSVRFIGISKFNAVAHRFIFFAYSGPTVYSACWSPQ